VTSTLSTKPFSEPWLKNGPRSCLQCRQLAKPTTNSCTLRDSNDTASLGPCLSETSLPCPPSRKAHGNVRVFWSVLNFWLATSLNSIGKRYGVLTELFSPPAAPGLEISPSLCSSRRLKDEKKVLKPTCVVALSAMPAPAVVAPRLATAPSSRRSQRNMPNPGR
jgi:hypothetical protein